MKEFRYICSTIIVVIFCALSLVSCSGGDKDFSEETNNSREEKITNVETCALTRMDFKDLLTLTATAEPMRRVTVSSEESGKITFTDIDEGRKVKKGDILVKQDIDLLTLQVKMAKSGFELAESDYKRIKKLFDRGSTSNQEMQAATVNRDVTKTQLDLAKLHLKRAKVYSPINGVILEKYVEFGEMIGPGTPLCKIIDTSTIKIVTGVAETELPYLKEGSAAELRFDIYPDRIFAGTISYIAAGGDTLTGTFPLEIHYDNSENLVKPGMIARLSLVRRLFKDAIVVPQTAVLDREGIKYLFIRESDIAREVHVKTGPANNNRIVVLEGLQGGEHLVVLGHRDLVNGEKINVVKTDGNSCKQENGDF